MKISFVVTLMELLSVGCPSMILILIRVVVCAFFFFWDDHYCVDCFFMIGIYV